MRPQKPRAPVFAVEARTPDSATLIVAAPVVQSEIEANQFVQLDERDVRLAFDVIGSSTEPVLPRVAGYGFAPSGFAPSQSGFAPSQSGFAPSQSGFAPTQSEPISVEYSFSPRPSGPISVDDFYGFAPRASAPVLPRMVTDPDLLRRRPSFARRAARKLTSLVSFCAIVASILAAVVLAFSWAFNVPLESVKANARSYEGMVALTQVGPVEHEPAVFAAPAVRPHAPVVVAEPIAPPRAKVASVKVASSPAVF